MPHEGRGSLARMRRPVFRVFTGAGLPFRTLRDSLSGWDPETQVLLLREELRAYKAVRADTGQERFNVICDLLELSPEETAAGAWARATHLVELAQVLCYHSFAQQTDW